MLTQDQRTDSPFSPLPPQQLPEAPALFLGSDLARIQACLCSPRTESLTFGEVPAGWDPGRVASCVPGKAETLRPCSPSAASLHRDGGGALGTRVD